MNTPTDYRALCSQLLDVIDNLPCETNYKNESRCAFPIDEEVVSRARLALNQPEPEGPTQVEAVALYSEVMAVHDCQTLGEMAEHFARAAIAADRARWGRPAIKPVPVSERPWEREGWCDADGKCWFYRPAEIACRLANGTLRRWVLDTPYRDGDPVHDTHSLPHHALPVPQPPVT